jgi:two-component system, OmpR family, response regulator RpaB
VHEGSVKSFNEKILVVDDEVSIRKILETRLSLQGYQIFLASNGKEALSALKKYKPDLVILDVMLPQLDGFDVCREIRKERRTPIIMLTALSDISNRVLGLDLGADDYIVKPFSLKELEARIRSVLRRTDITRDLKQDTIPNTIVIGTLTVDLIRRHVFKANNRVKLTGMEFNLLELLIKKRGESLSRASILKYVWGYTPERYTDTRVVDVHISRLRAKLEDKPSNPDLILTARGKGYMFQDELN